MLPTSVALFPESDRPVHVPLWTYAQLERLNRASVKNRALDLRDLLGADLPKSVAVLRASMGQDVIIKWILDVQVHMARTCLGIELTIADFGALPEIHEDAPMVRAPSASVRSAPYAMVETEQQPLPSASGRMQYSRPSTAGESYMNDNASTRSAHDDAVAGAAAAKLRNTGSFALGGQSPEPTADALLRHDRQYTPSAAPWETEPRRPTTASSQVSAYSMAYSQATEDSSLAAEASRRRNMGSFAFG
jgi:hypothetical protein